MRDSRRYHRAHRGPRLERAFSFGNQASNPSIERPFGYLPNNIARQTWRQDIQPFIRELGWGGGQGPLANILGQMTGGGQGGVLGNMIPALQQIGTDAATRGSQAFQGLQGQIDSFLNALPGFQTEAQNQYGALGGQVGNFLSQLPGFQQTAQGGVNALNQGLGTVGQATGALQNALGTAGQGAGYAGQFAQTAFDPTSQNQLYQQSGQRMLNMLRPGEAGRGMLSSGAGQQSEQDALRDLSFQFAQQQQGNQTQAIQNLLGASGQQGSLGSALGGLGGLQGQLGQGLGSMADLQAQLGQSGIGAVQQMLGALPQLVGLQGAGIGPAGQLMSAIPGLESLQTQPYQLPFSGMQNFLGMLGFGTGGAQNLMGATAPQLGQVSSGKNFGLL